MCTMACVSGGTECGALSPGAECIKFTTGSYCLEACEQGTPVADLSTKCGGRSDFVCADLGPSGTIAPFCVPNCRSNEECGPGLYCDKSDLPGLCTKTKPPSGDPVGASCNPNSTTNTCEGICIRTSADNVTPVTGECVEFCSGGFECMYGAGPNPTPGGFCAGKLSTTFGAIDVGFCLPNCSCSSDCQFEGFLCRKWPDNQSDLAMAVGAPGMCYPVVAQSVELSCGEGGAGGAGGASGAGGSGGDSAGGSGGDSSVPPASAGAAGSGI
jgi:uncharacterized membrane protein YgcG